MSLMACVFAESVTVIIITALVLLSSLFRIVLNNTLFYCKATIFIELLQNNSAAIFRH
jgi:hypothetical protein